MSEVTYDKKHRGNCSTLTNHTEKGAGGQSSACDEVEVVVCALHYIFTLQLNPHSQMHELILH